MYRHDGFVSSVGVAGLSASSGSGAVLSRSVVALTSAIDPLLPARLSSVLPPRAAAKRARAFRLAVTAGERLRTTSSGFGVNQVARGEATPALSGIRPRRTPEEEPHHLGRGVRALGIGVTAGRVATEPGMSRALDEPVLGDDGAVRCAVHGAGVRPGAVVATVVGDRWDRAGLRG